MPQAERYFHLCMLRGQCDPDRFYQAAFYLLSASRPVYDRAERFVDREGINFTAIKNNMKGMTVREKQIIRIAENLFKGDGPCMVTPADLAGLGHPLLDDVVNAIYVAAGQASVQVAQGKGGMLDLEIDMSRYHLLREDMQRLDRVANGYFAAPDDGAEVG